MSCEIIYDRRFIKLGEDKYIPIIQHGSSNCYEYSPYSGRDIPEKNWFNITYQVGDTKITIFTKKELELVAEQLSHTEPFKSRRRGFAPDEFKRWFLYGIKKAMSIEEYAKHGIELYATVDMYNHKTQQSYYDIQHISSNNMLEPSLQALRDNMVKKDIDPTRVSIIIGFKGRDCMKKLVKHRTRN